MRNTYLAIAITSCCNYSCFYCKQGGESISNKKETIPFSKLKQVINVAYDIGIRNFRITGGEPTSVSYFGELIEFVMNFSDTKIRINTNGFMIEKYIDILEKYKERLDVIFSVDSISKEINGICFPKYLSNLVINTTRKLREREISVRYNVVVTLLNQEEVKSLVLKAVDELKVNVKLLDLNKFTSYLGYKGQVSGQEACDLWKKLFVPMKNFYDFLTEISDDFDSEWTTGFVSKGNGIPMSLYSRNENWIQVKDSMKGANFSKFCDECAYFKKGDCQEGVFSLFLSSNLVLHLSGCKNTAIHFDVSSCNYEDIQMALEKLLSLF